MRFRFLGGLDCPDWLLSQFADYSKLTSIKFKNVCMLAVKFLLGEQVVDEDLAKYVNESLDVIHLKRFLGSLAFIMRRAVNFNCEINDVEAECIQLGLPPEHGKMLGKVLSEKYGEIRNFSTTDIPKEPCMMIESLTPLGGDQFSLNYCRESSNQKAVEMSKGQLSDFLDDMKKVGKVLLEKMG